MPSAFPMPSSFPAALQDPRVGSNPYATSAPAATTTYIAPSAGNALTALGSPPGMTPQDASQQTQTALAKLAAVNPQLADEFAQKYQSTQGGGWFDALKDVVGTIFAPAISAGGKLLDIIGRTSHIVPQWFDPQDQGSWFQDIGQALSGEDKTNWNEVFQHRGILENAGWLRATVGFALDVATDPLTYATFGAGAGVTTSEKALLAAKTVATEAPATLARLTEVLATKGIEDSASALLTRTWRAASGQADSLAVIRNFSDGGVDELLGMVGMSGQSEVRSVLADSFEAGAQAYSKVYGRTFKHFLQDPKNVMRSAADGHAIATAEQLKPVFEAIIKNGNFSSYADGVWGASKAAAGAMGGVRFRFALPFTSFRYISPMVPLSYKLGLGTIGRFGAGLGAMKVAAKVGPEAESLLMQQGWKGVTKLAEDGDEVAKKLFETVRAGRAGFARSAFYAGSEQVGHMTAHLTPGARQFRMGLGYYFAQRGMQSAKELRRTLTDDLFYKIGPSTESGVKVRSDLYRRYDAAFGKKAGLTTDQLRDARRYVDYFGHKDIPKTSLEARQGAVDDWFWRSRPDRAEARIRYENAEPVPGAARPGEQEFMEHQQILDDMKRVLESVPEPQRLVLDDIIQTEAYGKTTLERHGVDVGNAAVAIDTARVLHPDDVHLLGIRPDNLSQNFDAVMPQGVDWQAARYGGVTPEFNVPHEDLGTSGVRMDLTGASSGTGKSVPVQLRARNIVDVNMEDLEGAVATTKDNIVAGNAKLPEILAAVDGAFDDQGRALAAKLHPALDNHILELDWELTTRADLATEVLRSAPNAPDGVRYLRNGKPESMVIFDPSKVHVMTESAPHLLPQGGYFRRVLAPDLKAKLGGEARKGESRLFGDPAQIELKFRRETRDMTLEQAERHIRKTINSDERRYAGITIGDNEDVFQWDVMKGHEEYIGYLGDSYFATAMGRITSRMLELGNLVPNHFGAVANTSRAQFQTTAGRLAQLTRADSKLQDAAVKLNQRTLVEEQRSQKTLLGTQTRLATALGYVQAGLTGEDVPAQQLAASMDGVVRSSARLQEVVAKETARLNTQIGQLEARRVVTNQVHDALHVTEFEELDRFIEDRIVEDVAALGELPGLSFGKAASTDRGWVRRSLGLQRSRAAGQATDLGGGVWKVDELPGGVPGTAYYAAEADGTVTAYRAVDQADGTVITEVAKDFERQGKAGSLILAHWKNEGVTDFAGIKRMIAPNTYSRDGIALNKWAARQVLGEQGIHDPDLIKDLLKRGELYAGKDGNILTKRGGIRKGGQRVHSLDDIEQDLADARAGINELDDLRKPVAQRGPATIYKYDMQFESFETMAARRELQGGAPYRSDSDGLIERVDYQADEVSDTLRDAQNEYARAYESFHSAYDRSLRSTAIDDTAHQVRRARLDKAEERLRSAGGKTFEERAGEAPPSARFEIRKEADELLGEPRFRIYDRATGTQVGSHKSMAEAQKSLERSDANWYRKNRIEPPPARDVQAEQAARGGLTQAAEEGAQDDFAARLFEAAGVDTPPTDVSGLTPTQLRAAKRFEGTVEKTTAAMEKTLTRSERESFKRGGVAHRAHQRVVEATTELNRAMAEAQGQWAEMKPAVMFDLPPSGGRTGLRQVQIPGLGGIYAHPFVAEEMEHFFRGKPVGELRTKWREFVLGPWKRWATYRNPGFHVRNFFGAFFNNTLGGVDAADHEFSRLIQMARGNKKEWAIKPVSDTHWKRYGFDTIPGMAGLKGQLNYGDVADMLADMGIGRANTTSLAVTMGGEGLRDKARSGVGAVFANIDGKLRNAGGLTEDFFRTAAWAGGMRHMEGDLYGARAFAMVRHGDYGDLTDTEDFIRDLVPFYKWMRTNVPYQFRMLAENPGMFAAVDKAQTFVYDVQGLNRQQEEAKMPDWMKKGFHVPVPKGIPVFGSDSETNYAMFDLPYSDLYNGLRDYLSAGLPVIRNVIESYGIKQSVFTGAPLGSKMVPLSGLWANPVIAPLIRALPFAQKGADGQTYIPDTIENILGAVPQYSRFRNWMLADPGRVENRTATFTSALLGFGFRAEDATAAELGFYYDELLPAMENLRSMGYVFPTADQLHQAGSMVSNYGGQPTAEQLYGDGPVGQIGAA